MRRGMRRRRGVGRRPAASSPEPRGRGSGAAVSTTRASARAGNRRAGKDAGVRRDCGRGVPARRRRSVPGAARPLPWRRRPRDAARDPCGPFQESFVAGRLVGRQVGLRQVHVGVLATVGLGLVEFAVEGIDARTVGLHPEPLDDVQSRCQQLLAPGNPGSGGRTGAEQDVSLPVELFTEAGGIASDGREPSAVLGVAAGAVQVETDAVPGHVSAPGRPCMAAMEKQCSIRAPSHSCDPSRGRARPRESR